MRRLEWTLLEPSTLSERSISFQLRRFSEDVVDLQVCGDDAAKDFSEKELVDRWATAIQTKR